MEEETPLEAMAEEAVQQELEVEAMSEEFTSAPESFEKPPAPAPEESKDSKSPEEQAHDLLGQMRGLMQQYPMKIEFRGFQTWEDLVNNLLVVQDILNYCKFKSTKPDVVEQLQAQIDELEKTLDVSQLRRLYLSYRGLRHMGRRQYVVKIRQIIDPHFRFISAKVQYFSLAIPVKERGNMHLRSAQGLPAATAEEYEAEEIAEGETIKEGDAFKIEEGKVVKVS